MRISVIIGSCVLLVAVLSACRNSDPVKPVDIAQLDAKERAGVMDSLLCSLREELYQDEMYRLDSTINPPGCGLGYSYGLKIKVNNRHEVLIGGDPEQTGITRSVVEYFKGNREKNDVTNNFPLYNRTNNEELRSYLESVRSELRLLEQTEGVRKEVLEVKQKEMKQCENRLKALKTLGVDRLVEPSVDARVILDYPETYQKQDALIDSVLMGYYQLRNDAALKYWGESCLAVFYRFEMEGQKADENKLAALRILHPIRVRDVPYCKKNGIWIGTMILPVP